MIHSDPDILVDLTTTATAFEAEVIRDSLERAGVPAFAAILSGAMNPWETASSMPMRVQVRRGDLAAAERELEMVRRESKEIDWDAEDVGEPEHGEPAAAGPGRADWAEWHETKRVVGQTMLWLGSIVAFPYAIIVTAFVALMRVLLKNRRWSE